MGKSNKDGLSIGDRMKRYENVYSYELIRRLPVIVRIDGRAFHTITRKRFGKKWSEEFVYQMRNTALAVMADIQGCNFCYCQSDEVSFLLTDYKTVRTEAWFGYDLRKLISISASLASAVFSRVYGINVCFDSRAFTLPLDEVCNYFIWRQVDATRNAIQMAGREYFSHKQLMNKSCNEIQELLFTEKGINFNDFSIIRRRGFCLRKDKDIDGIIFDSNIPIFTRDRSFIEKFVYVRED